MNTLLAGVEPRVSELHVTDAEISARLVDGRTVSVPLSWSWRLSEATQAQRDQPEWARTLRARVQRLKLVL